MNNIKIYKDSPAPHDKILEKAVKVGLDKIDYSMGYKLVKTGTKNESPWGYKDGKVALNQNAMYQVIGVEDERGLHVWIVGFRINGNWFKTSPILNVEKVGDDKYVIETENSFYELVG